jgi:hypothetical protein
VKNESSLILTICLRRRESFGIWTGGNSYLMHIYIYIYLPISYGCVAGMIYVYIRYTIDVQYLVTNPWTWAGK